MAIDIGGVNFLIEDSDFKINFESRKELSINSQGAYNDGERNPMVAAYGNIASWTTIGTAATWAVPSNFDRAERIQSPNGPSASSLSYSPLRFTISVTGVYLAAFHLYSRDAGSGYPTGGYVHPQIGVNGSPSLRRPGSNPYRIRHHGLQGGYDSDTTVSEFIYLIAGDYVEPMHYMNNSNQQYYPQHSSFSVYFIG
jgi:hypothetical protein